MIDPLSKNGDIIKLIQDLQRRITVLESQVITNVNFGANGFLQVPQLSADPAAAGSLGGMIYYNTVTGKYRKYDGVAAAWKDFPTA